MLKTLKGFFSNSSELPARLEMKRNICIVGASRGLGEALARTLCGSSKYRLGTLVLVARNDSQLTSLRANLIEISIQSKVSFTSIECLSLDVNELESHKKLVVLLKRSQINCVINCAGFGRIEDFSISPFLNSYEQVQLNVLAFTQLAHTVARHFRDQFAKQKKSETGMQSLVNIASIAAFSPLPGMAVYAATKAYNFQLSLALDKEFSTFDAQCLVVCPGPIQTTLFDWSKTGYLAASQIQSPNACAKEILDGILGNKKIIVTGFSSKAFFALSEILPSQLKKQIASFYLNKGSKQ
jgi:uncharacterized protein